MDKTETQSTNQSDWHLILSQREFYCYLKRWELIHLSTVSRFLRNNLKTAIFQKVILSEYHPYIEKEELDSDQNENYQEIKDAENGYNLVEKCNTNTNNSNHSIIDKNINQLKKDLRPFQPYLIDLSAMETTDHYYITAVINTFQNLTRLSLFHTRIPLNSFTQILNDLNSLEYLWLYWTRVIKWYGNQQSGSQLTLPNSLRSLHLLNCEQITSTLTKDPNILNYDYYQEYFGSDSFNLHPQYLPNLENLTYKQSGDNVISIINQFITLNPHLKSLDTDLHFSNQPTLKLLQTCDQLRELVIFYNYRSPEPIHQDPFPTLESVQFLKFDSIFKFSFPLIEKLCLSCPNLAQLYLGYESSFHISYNSIISQLPTLDTLTLKSQHGFRTLVNTSLKLDYVKHLRLECFDPDRLELNQYDKFDRLQRITVQIYGCGSNQAKQLQNRYNQFSNWNCYIFPESIQCYRI